MPKVPYPYEVNGKLVTGNGSLIPICSLSNRSLLPSLTVYDLFLGYISRLLRKVSKLPHLKPIFADSWSMDKKYKLINHGVQKKLTSTVCRGHRRSCDKWLSSWQSEFWEEQRWPKIDRRPTWALLPISNSCKKKHKKVQCFNVIFVACCKFFCNLESTTVMANAGLLEVMAVVNEAEHVKALWTFLSNIIRISRWMCYN